MTKLYLDVYIKFLNESIKNWSLSLMNYIENFYHITLPYIVLAGGLVREYNQNDIMKWKFTGWGVEKGKKNIILLKQWEVTEKNDS